MITFTDQTKNRIVGLMVLFSIVAIFLPALMKKSNYRLDETMNVSVRMPKHPSPPQVNVPSKTELFANQEIPELPVETIPVKSIIQTVQAEPISPLTNVSNPLITEKIVLPAVNSLIQSQKKLVAIDEVIKQQTPVLVIKKQAPVGITSILTSKSALYAVQLATFSQEQYAKNLIKQLKAKGYKPVCVKINGKNGYLYKVLVGNLQKREEATNLQKELATRVQLKGFIVNKGVS
jgi:DedD protein